MEVVPEPRPGERLTEDEALTERLRRLEALCDADTEVEGVAEGERLADTQGLAERDTQAVGEPEAHVLPVREV
jgi:hypothetical protein